MTTLRRRTGSLLAMRAEVRERSINIPPRASKFSTKSTLQTELKDFNERILELESESRRGYAMEVLKAKAIDFARQIDELRCLLVRSKKGHKRSSVTVNFALWIKQLLDMAVQRLHDRNARQHCRTKNMHSAWGLNHRITGPSTCLPC
jgi:hypothetical protein